MTEAILWVILFSFLIDGIKVLFESLCRHKRKGFSSNHDDVTVIIPLYNREKLIRAVIGKAMKLFSPKNIIVVDDASTDSSLKVASEFVSSGIRIWTNKENKGKVRSIERALPFVRTRYALLLDADVFLPDDFRAPTSLITDKVTACAFNVMPGHGDWNMALKFQSYEYAKSMKIGKRYQGKTNSVSCVSGAVGLFKTDRLIELTKRHSAIWSGEDFERTLIELVADGEITFMDQMIETEAPKTFWELAKQRFLGWWPGLWRNIPLLFKILFKKRAPLQLRGEMAYLLFSLFTDPLKIAGLVMLILRGEWAILTALYLTYLTLEMIVWSRIRTQSLMAVVLFFFYNLFQMVLRGASIFVVISGKIVRNRWTSVMSVMICMTLSFSLSMIADDGVLAISYQKVIDSNGRKIDNINLYLGHKTVYVDINTAKGAPRYAILGMGLKVGGGCFTPEIRLKSYDMSFGGIYEQGMGRFAVRVGASYSMGIEKDFPILRVGADYYFGDYNYIGIDMVKEYGRKFATTGIARINLQFNPEIQIRGGAAVNNFSDVGWFMMIRARHIFITYSSFQNFDYCTFSRKYLGIGMKFKF